MRAIVYGMLIVCLLSNSALAAIVPAASFPWKRGYLTWKWDGPAQVGTTGYLLECGTSPGVYTISKSYALAQSETAMNVVLPTPGVWYCIATAMQGSSRGVSSAEYPFVFTGGDLILTGVIK